MNVILETCPETCRHFVIQTRHLVISSGNQPVMAALSENPVNYCFGGGASKTKKSQSLWLMLQKRPELFWCQYYDSQRQTVNMPCENRWLAPRKWGGDARWFNTLRPRQDGRHFVDAIFTCIFFNENCCIFIKFSLKYVRKSLIDNNPALVQIMAWRRSGDKPLSEPMMISLQTHIYASLGLNELTLKLQRYLAWSRQPFFQNGM